MLLFVKKRRIIVTLFILLVFSLSINSQKSVRAEETDLGNLIYLPLMVQPDNNFDIDPNAHWLDYLNAMRRLGSLPPLVENPSWSEGCELHSQYMVKTDTMQHSEDPSVIWYTSQGDMAARNSNLMMSSYAGRLDSYALDLWLTGPFHGAGLLDPELTMTGFGSYREQTGQYHMSACVDVLRGNDDPPANLTFPIAWPGPGTTMPLLSYNGSEFPNPLTSCAGYSAPSGPPIYLFLGNGSVTPQVTAHSFRQGNQFLDHCLFDETSYANPNRSIQDLGRWALGSRDAVVLMPRQPLSPGATYTVSITTNGRTHTWNFTANSSPTTLLAPMQNAQFGEPPIIKDK